MTWLTRILFCALGILMTTAVLADTVSPFYLDKERGWHWYEDPPPEKKKEVPPPPPPAPPKSPEPAKPQLFSAEWLRENLPRLRDEAIDNSDDPDKIRAYMYAQRVLFDKSQRFAKAASTMAQTDPLLDETNRIPLDLAAAAAVQAGIKADREEAIKYLAGVGGIMFFFDSTCAYCSTQFMALESLKKDYGFAVKNISVDGKPISGMGVGWVKDQGQARALGLTVWPTTIFAVPPDRYYIISQGFHSAETLGEKLVMAAITDKLLPERLIKSQQLHERGVLTPGDLRDPALNPDDTKAWVEQLRKKLGTHY